MQQFRTLAAFFLVEKQWPEKKKKKKEQGLRKDSEAATNWSICSAYFNLLSQRIKLKLKTESESQSLKPKLEAESGN